MKKSEKGEKSFTFYYFQVIFITMKTIEHKKGEKNAKTKKGHT